MNIKEIAQRALNQANSLVPSWLPGGKLRGSEWVCGDLSGIAGKSCSVNLSSGKWGDFSTGEAGGDLVSLYAAIHNLSQAAAAEKLSIELGMSAPTSPVKPPTSPTSPVKRSSPVAVKPPGPAPEGYFKHREYGKPTAVWTYTDESGDLLFYVLRFDVNGKKQYLPYSYMDNGKWAFKGWSVPRPLYNLHNLKSAKHVLIVEGEKAATAAMKTCEGHVYTVTTWPNGASAHDKADWSSVYGKNILIWPDHDEPGRQAAAKIAAYLLPHCPSVKIINTNDCDYPSGWDAADANFTWSQFVEWAKPLAVTVTQPVVQEKSEPEIPMPSEADAPNNINIAVMGDDAVEAMTARLSPNVNANVQRCQLQVSKHGLPTENLLNVGRVLASDFNGKFWFDEFYRSFMTDINGTDEPLHDSHIGDIQTILQANYGLRKISKAIVTDAITNMSYKDKRNAAKKYFLSLKWDGLARMDDFFGNACGADDSAINQAISRYFFCSIMARLFGPDLDHIYRNKVDSMLVIEGEQAAAKGMLLKTLIGHQWHFEVSRGVKDKDFFQDMRGKIIGEVAELAAFDGQNLDVLKRVVSCQTDRLRVSYGKESQDFDRTAILVGTTNRDEYLVDDTGNRRFLPIKITKVDLDYVREHREQVFAEAFQYYKDNIKTWWVIPKELLINTQETRKVQTVSDDYAEHIKNYLDLKLIINPSVIDIWQNLFKQDLAKLTQKNRNDISRALRQLGYENRLERNKSLDNKVVRVWAKPRRTVSLDVCH